LEKALQLDPSYLKAYARKGQILLELREWDRAIRTFEQGLTLDPEHKECIRGYDEAIEGAESKAASMPK